MDSIYLDHNATTFIDPRVADAMHACQRQGYANSASPHRAGRLARRVLESAREDVGRALGCRVSDSQSDRVIFTSGGTEANNLAVLGLAGRPPGRIILSSIEHPSVSGPAEHLRQLGFEVLHLPVSREGVVAVQRLSELLTEPTRLVSVMLGNNETGVLQPVQELAAICSAAGVPLHTDAVQVVGKIPVEFRRLGVSALSLAAHKFHGPLGVGALLVRHDVPLEPILFGGVQQGGIRPGTESVALAVGLRTALDLCLRELPERTLRMQGLRDHLESALRVRFPRLEVNGAGAPRLPHTSNLSFPGLDRQALLMALDLAGVACSTGSACASGSTERSPVLRAMGLPDELVDSSLRFGVGAFTSVADIEQAVDRISRVLNDLARRK
jgi:cysteine desulfurase